jgi:hypothetical protein
LPSLLVSGEKEMIAATCRSRSVSFIVHGSAEMKRRHREAIAIGNFQVKVMLKHEEREASLRGSCFYMKFPSIKVTLCFQLHFQDFCLDSATKVSWNSEYAPQEENY